MFEATDLSSSRSEDLSPGTVAWIAEVGHPVLVLHGPRIEPGEGPQVLFLDLGGEREFEVWGADDVAGYAAISVPCRLVVEIESRSHLVGLSGSAGFAFVSEGKQGIVGSVSVGRGSLTQPTPLTLTGERVPVNYDTRTTAFSRWRLVHGHGDSQVTLYERSKEPA